MNLKNDYLHREYFNVIDVNLCSLVLQRILQAILLHRSRDVIKIDGGSIYKLILRCEESS